MAPFSLENNNLIGCIEMLYLIFQNKEKTSYHTLLLEADTNLSSHRNIKIRTDSENH